MPAKPTLTQLSTLRKQIEESRRELGKWVEMSRSQLTPSPEEILEDLSKELGGFCQYATTVILQTIYFPRLCTV